MRNKEEIIVDLGVLVKETNNKVYKDLSKVYKVEVIYVPDVHDSWEDKGMEYKDLWDLISEAYYKVQRYIYTNTTQAIGNVGYCRNGKYLYKIVDVIKV